MNHYFTSTGERVTESQIQYRLRKAYKEADEDRFEAYGCFFCDGCLGRAEGHAHIIPKARLKQLRKTELIWDRDCFFHSCHSCNSICENVSSEAITKLKNFEYIKNYLEIHDIERFNKLPI